MSSEGMLNKAGLFLGEVGLGAACGAAAGATLGPVGAAAGAIVGTVTACSGRTIYFMTQTSDKSNFLKQIIVLAAIFFSSVGITMGIGKVTFTAACIFVGISTGYGLAALLALALIASIMTLAAKVIQ